MKTIIKFLILGLVSLTTYACADESNKTLEPVVVTAPKENKPETKRVCIMVLDNKTNKEVEKCRVMKIHEKKEGTKIPEKQ